VPVGGRIAGDGPGRGELPGTSITDAPTREHVPTLDAARGRPSTWSRADETLEEIYLIIAASTVLAAKLGRPEIDVRAAVREEIPRQFAGGAYDFRDALKRAAERIEADVRARRG
jgi:hypothetical protein